MLKRLAYGFAALFFLLGIMTALFDIRSLGMMIAVLTSLLLAAILFTICAVVDIRRGDLILRPAKAAKYAVIIFFVYLGLRAFLRFTFFDSEVEWTYEILVSAFVGLFFGFYLTRYRRQV